MGAVAVHAASVFQAPACNDCQLLKTFCAWFAVTVVALGIPGNHFHKAISTNQPALCRLYAQLQGPSAVTAVAFFFVAADCDGCHFNIPVG